MLGDVPHTCWMSGKLQPRFVPMMTADQVAPGYHYWIMWSHEAKSAGHAIEHLRLIADRQGAESVIGVRVVARGELRFTAYGTGVRWVGLPDA